MTLGENGATEADVLIHDETNTTLAYMLARMPFPEFPVALGVLHAVNRPTYDGTVHEQTKQARAKQAPPNLEKLLRAGNTWQV